MKLRAAALALGIVTGFVLSWARLTDPETFRAMLSLESPRVYLLMGAAVAVAFVGARLVRGRRSLLTGERIDWRPTRPTRAHVVGSVLFGIGWGITDACPGPTAAQLGGGRALAIAVAGGIVVGVWLQPVLVRAAEQLRRATAAPAPGIHGADVL
jgi:uncharacterized membrane protein YedE/YeeE